MFLHQTPLNFQTIYTLSVLVNVFELCQVTELLVSVSNQSLFAVWIQLIWDQCGCRSFTPPTPLLLQYLQITTSSCHMSVRISCHFTHFILFWKSLNCKENTFPYFWFSWFSWRVLYCLYMILNKSLHLKQILPQTSSVIKGSFQIIIIIMVLVLSIISFSTGSELDQITATTQSWRVAPELQCVSSIQ